MLSLTPRTLTLPAARSRVARSRVARPARALFGWGESAEDKERRAEQWEAQQEVLKRRKTGAWRKVGDVPGRDGGGSRRWGVSKREPPRKSAALKRDAEKKRRVETNPSNPALISSIASLDLFPILP
jgi:hypothetical protein